MTEVLEQPVLDFYRYPMVGDDDWRYSYATAVVRALEIQMLSKPSLVEMANTENFESAVEMLGSSEYVAPQGTKDLAQMEEVLLARRDTVRNLFVELMIDKDISDLMRAREDYANLRLALRRKLTDRPIGTDYSTDGSISAEQFEQIFEAEDYSGLPLHLQEAIEKAVLAYYQNKDIREIDYEIDIAQAEYRIQRAIELKNVFLLELNRMRIDLSNIRTMLRIKFTESGNRNVFLTSGYIETERLKYGIDAGYEAIPALFFATPYYELVESGVHYLASNRSFVRIESNCDEHFNGYLKSTVQITAGPQPVIAYFLLKEHEIRTVRFILTAKRNLLDKRLILDRIGG
jgi:V/A-type H+-transporting ATPase subunit C